MSKKNKLRPAARLGDLQVKFNQLKMQATRSVQNNADLVTIAIMRGEPVISLRGEKNSGMKPGTEIIPKPEEYPLFLTLAKQGSVITRETQKANEEYRHLKPILDKLEGPKQEYMRHLTQASEAAAILAGLEAGIAAARADVEAARANAARLEDELERLLDEAGID